MAEKVAYGGPILDWAHEAAKALDKARLLRRGPQCYVRAAQIIRHMLKQEGLLAPEGVMVELPALGYEKPRRIGPEEWKREILEVRDED